MKAVDVAPADVVDEITKSVVLSDVDAACNESREYGEDVPSPRFPVVGLKRKVEVPALPNATVLDANSPPYAKSGEVVAAVVVP